MKAFLFRPEVAAFLVTVVSLAVFTGMVFAVTWNTEQRIARHWLAHCEAIYADHNYCAAQMADELGIEP